MRSDETETTLRERRESKKEAGRRAEAIREKPMYKRILVPIDGSDTAERGLNEA